MVGEENRSVGLERAGGSRGKTVGKKEETGNGKGLRFICGTGWVDKGRGGLIGIGLSFCPVVKGTRIEVLAEIGRKG